MRQERPAAGSPAQEAKEHDGGRLASRWSERRGAAADAGPRVGSQAERTSEARPRGDGRSRGLGRIIIAVYGIFALAAFARSAWQVFGRLDGRPIFPTAPVAISLSVLAAVIYIVATIALARPGRGAWRVAVIAVACELAGVLLVSVLSLAAPELFPKASVWSHFGQGYGYVPLVLPFVGLWWLLTHRPAGTGE